MTTSAAPGTATPRALVPVLVFVGTVVAVISSLGAPLVPSIAAANDVSLTDAQWSLTVTLVVGAVATPVIGRLGSGARRRRVVLAALSLVVLGSVLAALPLGFGWLVAGRALQGFGLGLTPLTIATAREVLIGRRSASTVAALSITTVAGVGVGYPLTGLVAELGGVHAAFWAGAVVSALALLAAALVLPAGAPEPPRRLDVVGAVLLGIGLAAALLALTEAETWRWPLLAGCALVAVAALVAWVVWELRTPAPLVDVRLARGRTAGTAHAAALLVGLANYLMLTSVTLLAQTPVSSGYGFGASVVVAGLVLLPFSAASVPAGRVARALTERGHGRVVLPAGALVLAVAAGLFAGWRGELWQLFVVMGVAGVGVGWAFAGLPALLVSAVPAAETASAMSLNQVLRYIGFATGSALTAAVLEASTPAGAADPASGGYTVIALVAATLGVLSAVLTWLLPARAAAAR